MSETRPKDEAEEYRWGVRRPDTGEPEKFLLCVGELVSFSNSICAALGTIPTIVSIYT